jgi:hypothetical protein
MYGLAIPWIRHLECLNGISESIAAAKPLA